MEQEITKPHLDIARLASLSAELEAQVPTLQGIIPDITRHIQQIQESQGYCATYALGTIKAGKSTLLSALLEKDFLPRGSGVKTFNITRISHAPIPRARIRFKTSQQLFSILRFDLRMLGSLSEPPMDPYTKESAIFLADAFAAFRREASADGRLERIEKIEPEVSLLRLSFTRLSHMTRCLQRLTQDEEPKILELIRNDHALIFEGQNFDGYLKWANMVEFASIIQEIEISFPFPAERSPMEVLVDCQGSDSLNPLDFSAVDAALHRADKVFYVISSRLGLRIADRNLLTHLANSGLASKAFFILNVEAYEPIPREELDALIAKLFADLQSIQISHPQILAISALHELHRSTSPDDYQLILDRWEKKGFLSTLNQLKDNFKLLQRHLSNGFNQSPSEEDRVVNIFSNRLQNMVKGLLSRDVKIYGVQEKSIAFSEVKDAVSSMMVAEKEDLRKNLDRLVQETYDSHGSVQHAINQFFSKHPDVYSEGISCPENLVSANRHGEIIAAASSRFHADWMSLDQNIRLSFIHPLIEKGFQCIFDKCLHLYKLIPAVMGGSYNDDKSLSDLVPNVMQIKNVITLTLDKFRSQNDIPETLQPIILVPHIISGMAAEFYARQWFSVIKKQVVEKFKKNRIKKADEVDEVSVAVASAEYRKIDGLWTKTLKACFRAAKEDQTFSVSSARENMKFMYFAKACDLCFSAFQNEILKGIQAYYREVESIRSHQGLLLDGEDRRKLEEWLTNF